MQPSGLLRFFFLLVLFGAQPALARAQVETERPAHDSSGGLLFGPRAVFLESTEPGGGTFAGVEGTFGGWLSIEGPLALVIRARAASYATVRSPALELDDTACGGGGWGFSLCLGDTDMLALALGGELGLRLEHREQTDDDAITSLVGAELLASGTGYLDTFEHVREGGGLGAMLLLSAELVVRDRWAIGLDVAGRAEAGLVGSPGRLGVHGSLRFSFRP